MAVTPGYSGLLNSAYPQLTQYETARRRRPSAQMVQGLLGADLYGAKQLAMRQASLDKELSMRQQQVDIQKQAQSDAKMAGMVSGVGQLAQLPMAYGIAKSTGLLGSSAPAQGQVAQAVPQAAQMQSTMFPEAASYYNANAVAAPTAPAATSPGMLGGASLPGMGTAIGMYGAQVGIGKALQPTMDKAGLPTAGKMGTWAGLSGLATGATIDLTKKVLGGVSNFVKHIF